MLTNFFHTFAKTLIKASLLYTSPGCSRCHVLTSSLYYTTFTDPINNKLRAWIKCVALRSSVYNIIFSSSQISLIKSEMWHSLHWSTAVLAEEFLHSSLWVWRHSQASSGTGLDPSSWMCYVQRLQSGIHGKMSPWMSFWNSSQGTLWVVWCRMQPHLPLEVMICNLFEIFAGKHVGHLCCQHFAGPWHHQEPCLICIENPCWLVKNVCVSDLVYILPQPVIQCISSYRCPLLE